MTNNANKVWETFKAELIVEPTDDMKEALATSLRAVVECVYPGYDGIFLAWKAEILKIADELEVL